MVDKTAILGYSFPVPVPSKPRMRRKFPKLLAVLTWPILVLLAAPGMQPPLVGHLAHPIKPIKSWTAVASWYGPNFQGQTTASGQTFNMYALTAAHPWLPLGSLVRVVDLRTKRSQLVHINDRGPYVEGRQIDLSFMVASRIGLVGEGVGRVRIELLKEPPRP
jgi:peptidoglycan lytic transglycosylase